MNSSLSVCAGARGRGRDGAREPPRIDRSRYNDEVSALCRRDTPGPADEAKLSVGSGRLIIKPATDDRCGAGAPAPGGGAACSWC